MFADVTPAETTEVGWFANPVLSSSVTLTAVLALGALTWWLTRGDRLALIRDIVAGHVRRLLMKRASASPAPPSVEAPEARMEAESRPKEAPASEVVEEPAPTVEAPTPPSASSVEAPPPPKPVQPASKDAPVEEAPPWLMKALIAIASVPTLLALPLAAWSVAQVLPVPDVVALPIGILFDVAMVASVLIALLAPRFARSATLVGWVAAVLAAAAIVAHAGLSVAALFAAAPLVSKLLWGMVVQIRTEQARARQREAARLQKKAAEEARKAAELSPDLDHEQQVLIAKKKKEAAFARDMAAAELELELAESEAEHKKALAKIKRLGEQQRAEDKEEADVFEQRIRLERHLRTIHGQAPRFAVESGAVEAEIVPEAAPVGITNKAGFGGGFGFQRPLDVKALTPEGAKVSFEELPETHQRLVRYVRGEKSATIRGASRKLDRDPRTIRRWKDRLSELGYELPIGE